MDITKKVKRLLIEFNLTATQLAEIMEMTQPNLSKKMKNNSFTVRDLEKISEGLDIDLEINFVLKNEEKI